MKAIICVGISGSGKSTFARHLDLYQIICRDNARWHLSRKLGWNGPNKYKFDKEIEKAVTEYNSQCIYDAAIEGRDIIIADTNLNPVFRNRLVTECESFGYEVEIKEFPISFQEACRRDAQRGIFSVGEDVLMKQWESWIKYWESWIKYWEEKQQGAW